MEIAIIGSGASGLATAVKLSKHNNVYIFEKNKSAGRKLLATGNGKANILNINANKDDYNNDYVLNALNKYNARDVLSFFNELGLLTRVDEEGRVYPYNNSSLSVLNILLDNCKNAKFVFDYTVNKITLNNDKYIINDYKKEFDIVILSSGSNASIVENKQLSTYKYLKDLNIKFSKLKPSLVGFEVYENIKILSGYRSRAKVTLNINNDKFIEYGEVIFKDNGISGIVIMNMSFIYNKYKNINKASITIDLMPDLNIENISNCNGVFHPTVINYINKFNIDQNKMIHDFTLTIKKTYDYKFAQIVSGGIDLAEVDNNFMLKKYKNIYACGEVLDIDGKCGGYNLLFAFSSGLSVANTILENEN